MFKHYKYAVLAFIIFATQIQAQSTVQDYLGRTINLSKPAKRIIALAPHIVENLYSAGAGSYIVGAVDYCDYPEQAKQLPRVGAISSYSIEAILALKPDLVVVWHSGRGGKMLGQLDQLGIRTYASDPRKLEDVAKSIRDFGRLAATEITANKAADDYLQRLTKLKNTYQHRPRISTLYQVWNSPIQTLNNEHIISDVIRLCGGENAFGDSPTIAPKISVESVIARNPKAIIASGMGEERPEWLDTWKKWTSLSAVQNGHLYFVPPDIIQRHTERILDGAGMICEYLEQVRRPSI